MFATLRPSPKTFKTFVSRAAPSGRRFLSVAPRLTAARPSANNREAEVSFGDGSSFLFHALWLRDACRDASHVEAQSERVLHASPLVARLPLTVGIKNITLEGDGESLSIEWDCGELERSTFAAGFLRALAPRAGKQLVSTTEAPNSAAWFEFLNGKNDTDCPTPDSLRLWDASAPQITRVPYADLRAGRVPHEDMLRAIVDPGVVIVEGMPPDANFDGSTLSKFAAEYLGGLQKHPRRDNAHWTISTEETVENSNMVQATRGDNNAYDTKKQLCNHTDQSLYGTPGLLLMFHVAHGEGNNSLTDGFAVASALRERDPEAFKMLTQYGMNAGRHLGYYTSGPLLFDTSHPVLQLDRSGNLARVQYHESYRTPLTVPYADFPRYLAALDAWYSLVHDPEFQTHLTLREGELLIMNNWRTMHGRAGLAGKTRTILGGTVTREAFYSAVRQLAASEAGVALGDDVGVSTPELVHIGTPKAPLRPCKTRMQLPSEGMRASGKGKMQQG